jgi:mono/diheme cytochrome c family protein
VNSVVLMVVASAMVTAACTDISAPSNSAMIERGRYLVKITGCNDCHTPSYAQSGGEVTEEQWLIGDPLGWSGPWGTTYASNLRLFMQTLTEDQWVQTARTAQYRPPMPWPALHAMTEDDLRALYQFIRNLGPAGEPAPAYVAPGQTPAGPVVVFPPPPK